MHHSLLVLGQKSVAVCLFQAPMRSSTPRYQSRCIEVVLQALHKQGMAMSEAEERLAKLTDDMHAVLGESSYRSTCACFPSGQCGACILYAICVGTDSASQMQGRPLRGSRQCGGCRRVPGGSQR